MKKGWTSTKLIAVGTVAVLDSLARWLLYSPTLAVSGSVFAGIIALIISPFFLTLAVLLVDQFWAATLFLFLSFIIDLPSPKLFPPIVNFVQTFIVGLPVDVFQRLLNTHKLLAGFLSGAIYNLINSVIAISLFYTVGLTGTRHLPEFLTTPLGLVVAGSIMVFVGGLCGVLSWVVYQSISGTNAVRRIRKAD